MFFDKKEFDESSPEHLAPLIDQAVGKGAIFVLFHFDAHGSDEQSVRDSLIDFIARLSKEPGVIYASGEIEKALEDESIFSCCSEVKILAEDLSALLRIALKYGPMAVEVIKPHKRAFDAMEMQAVLLDASMTAQEFSKFVLDKTVSPEKKAELEERLKRRADWGRELREKAEKNQ
ncbi:MAG: hypothetical protein V1834_01530 [Candidatus Micrarchaeota archaeon]